MVKQKTIENIQAKLVRIHDSKVSMVESTYIGSRSRATFEDKEYGQWTAFVGSVLSGTGHPKRGILKMALGHKLSINEVEDKIKLVHGDSVKIKKETYVNMGTKCAFTDAEYGDWIARPENVVRGTSHPVKKELKRKKSNLEKYGVDNIAKLSSTVDKTKTTNIKLYGHECSLHCDRIKEKTLLTMIDKYGVPYAAQNKDIALIIAKKQEHSYYKKHWKTNEELVCQASWESKVVDYLNENKIEFDWQPQTFKMPNGKTYRPDFYLIKEDRWIEIKGYMRPNSKIKWDWFQTIMPNSELWNKEKLKILRIL